MPAPSRAVVLESVRLDLSLRAELRRYTRAFAESAPNLLRRQDYARWSVALRLAPQGASVLDVGVGAGQFVNAAARSGRFTAVTGLDVRRHSKFIEGEEIKVPITYADATAMPFEDGAFDVAFCMEVIEHLEPDAMRAALAELRRVARAAIVVSVPYAEPEPISKYHRQRFAHQDLDALFPNAERIFLVERNRVPWVLIRERSAAP